MAEAEQAASNVCRQFRGMLELREAQVTGQLEHPNIVPVYELGRRKEDNQPYYAMRLIRGRTLREVIADRFRRRAEGDADPLERPRLLQAFIAVCQAVGYAHSRGVIHRDLKPENVIIGDYGEAIVLDWGLARLMSETSERASRPVVSLTDEVSSHATQAGGLLGTPAYMAPEQAEGLIERIDARTDIYGLGAILFEILTGRAPHAGQNVSELLHKIVTAPTPRARSVEHSVPPPLDAICARAMARISADRYASATDLSDEVQRWLADEPVKAYPESWSQRVLRWSRRHQTEVRAAAAFLLAVVGLAIFGKVTGDARLARLRTQTEKMVEQGEAAMLRDDLDASRVALAGALGRVGTERSLTALRDRATRLLAEADHRLNVQTQRHRDQARYEDFAKHYDDALFHGTLFTGLGESLERAKREARQALAVFGISDEHPSAAPPLAGLLVDDRQRRAIEVGCFELLMVSSLAEAQAASAALPTSGAASGSSERAIRLLERACRFIPDTRAERVWHELLAMPAPGAGGRPERRAAREPDDLVDAVDHFLVGIALYYHQDLKQACREFEAAVGTYPDHYWSEFFLALCQSKLQRPGEAKAAINACLGRKPKFDWAYIVRGNIASDLRDYDSANRDFTQAMALAADPVTKYFVLVTRGAMRIRQNQLAAAIDDLKQAIALEPKLYPAYANLAAALAAHKEWKGAVAQLDQAIQLAPNLASLYRNRARIRLESGAGADALRDSDKALQLVPRDHPLALLSDAESQLVQGHPRDAVRSFDHYEQKAAPDASFYQGRGLAKALLGDYSGAVEDYSQSLELEPNTNVYARRASAYLHASDRLALRDFERSLSLNDANLEAHAGRGYALTRLGRYREGVAEAERAFRSQIRDWRIVFNIACVYAQADGRARADVNTPDHASLADQYRERAVALLRTALDRVQNADRRPEAWRTMAADAALDPIRGSREFARLAAEFEQHDH